MKTTTEDIHCPVVRITVRGELVEVKELKWKMCLRAVKDMTATILKLLGPSGTSLVLDKEKIVEAIGAQEELVTWVLMESTGRTQEWVDGLSVKEVMPLVHAVVDLNLSDEVVAAGKGLAGRMGAVFGQTKPSPVPSTR